MLAVESPTELPIAAARRGDPSAWQTLCQRYRLPLYVYVRELLGAEDEAMDVVQESFLNAVRHLGTLRDDSRFGSWLFRIAHQKCIQRWRDSRKQACLFADSLDDSADEVADSSELPSECLIREERAAEFMALLARLKPAQRSVLLLHFVEEFSLQEIADITEVPLGTVKSRLHYAKRTFRGLVEQDGTL